jgi:hypothetical protein
MDKATEHFNKSSQILLEAEVKLNTICLQIADLDRQLALLNSVEAHLKENIGVLQRKRVIVMVNEFRKAKTDLNTCHVRQAFLRVDRENHLKVQTHCQIMYDKARYDYEQAFNMLHNPPNNVIEWDFRRKDGQG